MKQNIRQTLRAVLLTGTLLTASHVLAQTAVTQSAVVMSDGTITEFSPEALIIRSATTPAPVSYGYTTTTTYVDETGAPVLRESVKSGQPVTVYYVKEGDRMVASKVIVKKAVIIPEAPVVVPASPVIEKTTTTTTTTD